MTRPVQATIFGGAELARPRRGKAPPRPAEAQGYADLPGTGPEGETCGTCQHCAAVHFRRSFYKCRLLVARWSRARSTDILVTSPACARFEPAANPVKPKRKPKKPKARKSLPERLE